MNAPPPGVVEAGPGTGELAAAEELFLAARDLRDRLEIAAARGVDEPGLDRAAAAAAVRVERALAEVAGERLSGEDVRALAVMTAWLDQSRGDPGSPPPSAASPDPAAFPDMPAPSAPSAASAALPDAGWETLSGRVMADYAVAEAAVTAGGETFTRLAALGRLGEEDDPARRREIFLALEPTWRSVAGDGGADSPYRRLVRMSAWRWAGGRSPVRANAVALGMDPDSVEPVLVEVLRAWRAAAAPSEPVEPWDFWHAAGAAGRALRAALPLEGLLPLARAYHAAIGADLDRLEVGFDIVPRPGRLPVPVAYTTFGGRPRLGPDGSAPGARPWVFASYTAGGLGELTELIHEVGHAVHIAAVATRPAFADWPDSDALTEALAELLALDTAEPDWQRRWLGTAVPEQVSLRGRYAEVMLDICWALLEIRLHAAPERSPDEVWAELTSAYLNIAPHPEWPWWAMRGQLVDAPGYMSNYAIGPILTADLRAAIRAARGDWTGGDPGWFGWVSERIYRWGLSRSSADVLRSALGRGPSPDALLAEIARAG